MSAGAAFNAAGLAVCALVYVRRATSAGLCRGEALEVAMAGVIGALVGSRVGAGLLSHAVGVVGMLRGQSGAMSWGAYAGGLLAASVRLRAGRRRWIRHVDAAAPAVLMGIAIARLGCFAEGDDFGTVCHYAWCVRFGEASEAFALHRMLGWIVAEAHRSLPVQPLQLYFSLTAAAAAVAVFVAEGRTNMVRIDGTRAGSTALFALILYTASRAPLELLRETAGRGASGVSSLQIAVLQLSVALALAVLWWVARCAGRSATARGSARQRLRDREPQRTTQKRPAILP